jgi:ATP-dependent Clp protease protease subunit
VFEGNTIHNMIKAHKAATKTVIIDGLAASIASIIAMAGDKIVMPKNA